MNRYAFISAIMLSALAVAGRVYATTATAIPYADGFESYTAPGALPTSGPWSIGGTGQARVQNVTYTEGTRACFLSNAVGKLNIASAGNYTNVWIQVYSQLVPYDDWESPPPVPAGLTGVFYVNTGGVVRVYGKLSTTNGWSNLVTTVSTSSWRGYVIHADYKASNWDLFIGTSTTYGVTFSRANQDPIVMLDGALFDRLGAVAVSNKTYIDAVAVTPGYTNCSTAVTNVLTVPRTAGRQSMAATPPFSYGSSDDLLATGSRLGDDLSIGLAEGDQLRIFGTNVGWSSYIINGGDWNYQSGVALNAMHILPTMGFWIIRGTGTNTVAFYPNTQDSTPTDPTIYGTGDTILRGWNLLGWPYAEHRAANSTKGWGFANAAAGDMIMAYENTSYTILWWDVAAGNWKSGRNVSSYTLKPGQGFWYYRAAAGTTTWPVAAVK